MTSKENMDDEHALRALIGELVLTTMRLRRTVELQARAIEALRKRVPHDEGDDIQPTKD